MFGDGLAQIRSQAQHALHAFAALGHRIRRPHARQHRKLEPVRSRRKNHAVGIDQPEARRIQADEGHRRALLHADNHAIRPDARHRRFPDPGHVADRIAALGQRDQVDAGARIVGEDLFDRRAGSVRRAVNLEAKYRRPGPLSAKRESMIRNCSSRWKP